MLRQLVVGQVLTLVGPRAGHEVSPCAERRGRARLYCRNGASAQNRPHVGTFRPAARQRRSSERLCRSKVRQNAREVCVARWYDPATGEFLSVDPDFNATLDAYGYADESPLDGTDPSGLSSGYYPGTYEGECNDQIALMLQTQAIKQHKKLTTSQLQTEIKAVDTQDDQATISRQLQQIAAEDKADPTVAKDAENALKTGGKSGWGVLAMIACTLATGGAGGAVADVAEGLTDVAVEMTADMSADAVEGVEAAAPSEMTGFTQHGLEQAMTRDGGLGVSDSAMEDAVQNPTKVVPQANGTCQFVGKDATVVLNKDGQVVTTWARNRAGWRNAP
jgi:hypothetical protein